MRQGRFAEIDLENIIEELESMARSDKIYAPVVSAQV
ncbi:DUF29 family protein [Candidatus Magnetobacterium casense]